MGKYDLETKQYKIDPETATAQFMLFLNHYNIDLEKLAESQLKIAAEKTGKANPTTAEIEKEADRLGDDVVDIIRTGHIEIAVPEDGYGVTIQQNFKNPPGDHTSFKFGVLKGKHKKGMPTHKDPEKRIILIAESMLENSVHRGIFEKLSGYDTSVFTLIGTLFSLC